MKELLKKVKACRVAYLKAHELEDEIFDIINAADDTIIDIRPYSELTISEILTTYLHYGDVEDAPIHISCRKIEKIMENIKKEKGNLK